MTGSNHCQLAPDHHHDGGVRPLIMTVRPPSLSVVDLKKIKNTVIGNPSAKVELAQDEDFIRTCVTSPQSCCTSESDDAGGQPCAVFEPPSTISRPAELAG